MHRTLIQFADYSGGNANFVQRGKKPGDCECSPGCRECYVKRIWVRNPDAWPDKTKIHPQKLASLARCRPTPRDIPYRRGTGSKPMVFVCDTGDLFHYDVPREFVYRALDMMESREDIDWQIVTKRHERAYYLVNNWLARRRDALPPWMWIIYTICDQEEVDTGVPFLLKIPAAVRGLSIEPMLGPVDINSPCLSMHSLNFADTVDIMKEYGEQLWVICGGESGVKARPMQKTWPQSLRDQCIAAKAPFFFKQWGEYLPVYNNNYTVAGYTMTRVGRKEAGRILDGVLWEQYPEVR